MKIDIRTHVDDDDGVNNAKTRNPSKDVYRDRITGKVHILAGKGDQKCKLAPKDEFMAKANLSMLNEELNEIKRELGPAIIEQGKDGIRVRALLKKAESVIEKRDEIERATWG